MPNYEIKVQVDIRPTEQDVTPNVAPCDDGSFRIVIGRDCGQSIDPCEQALLAVNYPAIREALAVGSQHIVDIASVETDH
jgi:hypothetical protein